MLKNAIDWISRVQSPDEARGQVYHECAFAIASASVGQFGGARCLAQLRLILAACGAMVIPNQLALSFAGDAYDDMERLKRSADADVLKRMVRQLIAVSGNMR